MIRWAVCAVLALLVAPLAAAQAGVPVPRPKPDLAAAPGPSATSSLARRSDPQAAISHLMEDKPLGNVAAYAAAGSPALLPAPMGEVALYLVGKMSDESAPISEGLVWRVFGEVPGPDGQLPLVHKARGGDLELRLKPGRYIVHVSYGRAAQSRSVDLRQAVTSETFVLNAGGLQLAAVLDDSDRPLSADTEFELYGIDQGERALIGSITAGAVARLPAGSYHIVSRYGGVNAVRSADVVVEPGKLTRVSLRHQAGTVRLKLVRSEGGEALADTAWTIYGTDGNPVFERVGAYASLTLAAGTYRAVARHRDAEFIRTFVVESGEDEDVVVLARRL